jgi:uncharacterized membrane protein (DUF4010 family)
MVLQDLPSIIYLFLTVAVGAIVGLENEYRMQGGAKIYLGLRTSIFIALLGYILAMLFIATSNVAIIVAAIGVITVIATVIYIEKTEIIKDAGATTFVGVFLLFFSGLLIGLGYYEYGIILSIMIASFSFYKKEFLEVIHKIKRKELIAALNLLIISFLILPLLPDSFIGPGNFFNPFEFWLIVAMVGAVFFFQYLVLRFSKVGLFISSLIGSAVTGTAVTYNLIKFADKVKNETKPIFYNIMFSTNLPMIFIQAILFICIVTSSLQILTYLIPVIIVSLIAMIVLFVYGRKNLEVKMPAPANPFPIIQTLEFAVIFFAIFTISRAVNVFVPQLLALTLFVSALANVASSTFALGFLFLSGDVSASFAALLLGLIISASVLEKGFIALISKDNYIKLRVFVYSLIIGVVIMLTALLAYHGI